MLEENWSATGIAMKMASSAYCESYHCSHSTFPVLFADGDGEGGGQEEDEEELQRRLVQLLNLPTAPPSETLLTEDAEQNHADKVKSSTY